MIEYEADIQPVVPDKENILGLDYKTSCLYMDSNGHSAGMPKYYKADCRRLAKAQRKLKHKVPGSANYRKQMNRCNCIHRHTANQRNDFLHKLSAATAKQYDMVCIEDISIQKQVQDRKYRRFRRSTLDNGWYHFTVMLEYKLRDRGKRMIRVPEGFPSTKMCHCCGAVNEALNTDSIRKWECPVCGMKHDRDINAAINIKNEGYRIYLESCA